MRSIDRVHARFFGRVSGQPICVTRMVGADRQSDALARFGRVVHGGDQLDRQSRVGECDRQSSPLPQRVVEAIELASVVFGEWTELHQRRFDSLGQLGRVADERPRIARVGVGTRVALGHQTAEREAVTADLVGRAKRHAQRGRRAIGHLERHGGAVLDFDGIDARGGVGEDAPRRAEHIAQQVVGVDRVAQQRPAALGRPLAPPRHLVVRGAPPPGGLHRGQVRRARQALAISSLSFCMPWPKRY